MNAWYIAALVGAVTGIVSGMGVGGGSLLVLYLTWVSGMPQFAAGGINLLYFLGCAPAAIEIHLKNKLIDWKAAGWAAVGVLPCAAAAYAASVIDADWLRRAFGVMLLYIGWKETFGKRKKTV